MDKIIKLLIVSLLACIILLTNSFSLSERENRLEDDKYVFSAVNADTIPAVSEHAKTRLRMTLFSQFTGIGVINYYGINDAVSVKGSLSYAPGKGLANREISIYVDHILMGKTRTNSEGCFYFNNWNNTALKPLIDRFAGSGVFGVKIWSIFHGDHDYRPTITYKRDSIYTGIVHLHPRTLDVRTTEAVVNAGGSVDVPVVIQLPTVNLEVQNLTLSLDALPCNGVNVLITPSVIPSVKPGSSFKVLKSGNSTTFIPDLTAEPNAIIHISLDSNVEPGHYWLMIVGEATYKNLDTGEQTHLKQLLGLLQMTVKPLGD